MIITLFCLFVVFVFGFSLFGYFWGRQPLKGRLRVVENEIQSIALEKVSLEEKLRKITSQKKSSEVRTGLIVEQMAPFLEGFVYDSRKAIFLGRPLDFVVFDDTGVHFVEVKSGKSQLSSTQRKIRDQIKAGNVTFEIYRIKGE